MRAVKTKISHYWINLVTFMCQIIVFVIYNLNHDHADDIFNADKTDFYDLLSLFQSLKMHDFNGIFKKCIHLYKVDTFSKYKWCLL